MGFVPRYSDLLGQEELAQHFAMLLREDRLPHALLLVGEDGGEVLPLALALSRQILCEEPLEEGFPCGRCASCRQMDQLQHPDLNLVFPVVRTGDQTTSEQYLDQFIELVKTYQRFTEAEWRAVQNAGNKQLQIMVAEAERLIHATALRSFKNQHQVILVWKPEALRTETANKLLKLLEEPPTGVVFIMVSHEPQRLLPTITSRLQRVTVPRIPESTLVDYLKQSKGIPAAEAEEVGHLAQGSLYKALQLLNQGVEDSELFRALDLLLLPQSRDPKLFLAKAQEIAKLSRPEVISLLDSLPLLIRELLAIKYGEDNVIYLPSALRSEAEQLANNIELDNFAVVMKDLKSAKMEIQQNANVQIVFFDLLLNLATLTSRN